MDELTAERLREVLDYDPDTGVFTWRRVTNGRIKVGQVAGGYATFGYLRIAIDGRKYFNHRLAWLYQTGSWPEDGIDHINGNKSDNRFSNLREATHAENMRNRDKLATNTSGFKGVVRHNKRWMAQIKIHGTPKCLGYFDTPEEAHAAYATAAKELFGAFANVGAFREARSTLLTSDRSGGTE